jgi:hypothetical protein
VTNTVVHAALTEGREFSRRDGRDRAHKRAIVTSGGLQLRVGGVEVKADHRRLAAELVEGCLDDLDRGCRCRVHCRCLDFEGDGGPAGLGVLVNDRIACWRGDQERFEQLLAKLGVAALGFQDQLYVENHG